MTRRHEVGQGVVLSVPISMIYDKASLRRSLRGPVDLSSTPVAGMGTRTNSVVEDDAMSRDLPAGWREGVSGDGHVSVPGGDLIQSLPRVGAILRAEASLGGSGDSSPLAEERGPTRLADALDGGTTSPTLSPDEHAFVETGRMSVGGIARMTSGDQVLRGVVVLIGVQMADDDSILVGPGRHPAQRRATPMALGICGADRVVEHHATPRHHSACRGQGVVRSLQISGHLTSVAQYPRCVSYFEMG